MTEFKDLTRAMYAKLTAEQVAEMITGTRKVTCPLCGAEATLRAVFRFTLHGGVPIVFCPCVGTEGSGATSEAWPTLVAHPDSRWGKMP